MALLEILTHGGHTECVRPHTKCVRPQQAAERLSIHTMCVSSALGRKAEMLPAADLIWENN